MSARLAFALAASFAVAVSAQQAPTQQQEQPYRPGPAIENPVPIRSVQPKYPRDAMTNRIEGGVEIEAVVMPDGTVGQVQVVKSLDAIHGLDNEAMAAAKQWLFRPGMRKSDGRAVPVIVTIILEFRLGPSPTLVDAVAPATVIAGDDFYQDTHPLQDPKVVRPRVIRSVQPKYTSEAMRNKLQGTVEVEAVIGTNGQVMRARLKNSIDSRFGLDESALEAANSWVFEPATLNGQPIPVAIQLTLEFRLH